VRHKGRSAALPRSQPPRPTPPIGDRSCALRPGPPGDGSTTGQTRKPGTRFGGARSCRGGGDASAAAPDHIRRSMAAADGRRDGHVHVPTQPVGLLLAPPSGWGDQGGLVERPTHPKPTEGSQEAHGRGTMHSSRLIDRGRRTGTGRMAMC
jgi:hypothetical protein